MGAQQKQQQRQARQSKGGAPSGPKAKQSLGQNFLTDVGLAKRIAASVKGSGDDGARVLESPASLGEGHPTLAAEPASFMSESAPSGMPSNRIFISSTLSIATPALPTSPVTRGWSLS